MLSKIMRKLLTNNKAIDDKVSEKLNNKINKGITRNIWDQKDNNKNIKLNKKGYILSSLYK